MGINLSKLNISLEQFNAAASGKYNIGQLKLSGDGTSVYRTNNHKTWTIFNKTSISPEESLALKFTFCKALQNEGLSDEDMATIKTKLGIPGSQIDALKAGRLGKIKPLSAAEVRAVIDEFADKINKNRMEKANDPSAPKNAATKSVALKTSSEIYRGVSKKTLDSRAATRAEVNEQTLERMETKEDTAVNSLLDILQYPNAGDTVSKEMTNLANELFKLVSNPHSFTKPGFGRKLEGDFPLSIALDEDRKFVVKLQLDTGNTMFINTDLDREGLLDQMAKILNANAPSDPNENLKAQDKQKTQETQDAQETQDTETETLESKQPSERARASRNRRLLKDLDTVFDLLKPESKPYFELRVDDMMKQVPLPKNNKVSEKVASKLMSPHDAQRAIATSNVRESLRDQVIPQLQKALDDARGLDTRNADIINKVRDVIGGDTRINSDELLEEIKEILDTKVIGASEKVAMEIEAGVEDNVDEVLKINDWLGR